MKVMLESLTIKLRSTFKDLLEALLELRYNQFDIMFDDIFKSNVDLDPYDFTDCKKFDKKLTIRQKNNRDSRTQFVKKRQVNEDIDMSSSKKRLLKMGTMHEGGESNNSEAAAEVN